MIISYFLGFISYEFVYKKKKEIYKNELLDYLLSNFISYSPDLEDFILFYLFYDTPRGFYIDVGAHDPNLYSVTKAFYQRKWKGINIDPLPNKYLLFQKFRTRDINLQLGAGNKEGNTTLKLKNDQSSIIFDKNENNSQYINISIKTLSNICKMYVPKNIKIDFCKIDVERAEKLVLLGYDFQNYRPKIFCIESLFNNQTNTSEYEDWENILLNNDYKLGFKYRRNKFYYDKRIIGLKDKFNLIDFYTNKYKYKRFIRYAIWIYKLIIFIKDIKKRKNFNYHFYKKFIKLNIILTLC